MTEKLTYITILTRCFGRFELRRLGFMAFIGSFLIAFIFCTLFRSYLGPLSVLNRRLSLDDGLRMLRIAEPTGSKRLWSNNMSDTESSQQVFSDNHVSENKMEEICRVEARTAYCDISGDVRINGKSGTVLFASSGQYSGIPSENSSWIIKPYARRGDLAALGRTRGWTVKLVENENQENGRNALPYCMKNHSVPAIIFSLGGYAGNYFHDFTDVLIPLYLTSRKYNGEVHFLVSNRATWWIKKFQELLKNLSNYDFIYIDEEEDIHCFGNVIVGLKRHPEFYKELMIDPSTSLYSMSDFIRFIRNTYRLAKPTAINLKQGQRRPRILILSRMKTRIFINTNEISEMARRLGFEVVVAEANMSLSRFSQVVNSCDVMMGVHGAGLTNMVFLPKNAVLIQVLPIGGFEWLARTDFADPLKSMNLRYLEYKIGRGESTLSQRYPVDHEVMKDPLAIAKREYAVWKSVYLVQQNVILDVRRFRLVLLEALELLRH